jgi:hypothetical protein
VTSRATEGLGVSGGLGGGGVGTYYTKDERGMTGNPIRDMLGPGGDHCITGRGISRVKY